MIRVTARTARKPLRCGYGSTWHEISKGDRYLEHVISPMHGDIDNPRWDQLRECQVCAERYGRGHLFGTEEATP